MNYLAHLYFSDPDPLAWAGSLLGDFYKGPIAEQLPQQLRRHLQLHRRIDSFTQENRAFQSSRRRLHPRFRYGRSVLVDVFYDHFLAQNWSSFHQQSLVDFSQQVYTGLAAQKHHLSAELLKILPRMSKDNWLYSYRREEIVARVLHRLEERLKYRLPLAAGYSDLQNCREELTADFYRFMAEAEIFVRNWKQQNS